MQFLCLAYGHEKDWLELTRQEQDELLAQDQILRDRGALVSVVGDATTVTAWDGSPVTSNNGFAKSSIPLAGFSVIEAADINEAVQLVANTPCARARGAVEIRALMQTTALS